MTTLEVDIPVMLSGISVSHPRWGKRWDRGHRVPLRAAHTFASGHTGWEGDRDEIVVLVVEVDMLCAGTAAAPGRCRNSCASAPPYAVEADGHARVVVAATAQDRCRSN